jgi:hemerythrin-like metal-binding protein
MANHFVWGPELSVNVKLIDEQHKKFVQMLDDYYQAILKGRGKQELLKLFEDLDNYSNYHFATEEKYFDEFNFEGSAEHKAEHNNFRAKVADIKKRADAGEEQISTEIIDFLEDWLVKHVNGLDKKYTKCFNEHGLF